MDILGLENKNAYNKVIYIKCEEINDENINVDNFIKMFDLKEINKTIPSTGYSINNIAKYILYGCYERKLDRVAKLTRYYSDMDAIREVFKSIYADRLINKLFDELKNI